MSLRIERLRDQPGVAEQLAVWHVREWGHLFHGWDEAAAQAEFAAQALSDDLPATWLAFHGDALIGSISALLEDSPHLRDFPGPWLASFYIAPEYRGQGAAQALMNAAALAVAGYGHRAWYLFTPAHAAYYQRHGWQTLAERSVQGEPVAVMRQDLPTAQKCAQASTALK